jgi:hypothetical protein
LRAAFGTKITLRRALPDDLTVAEANMRDPMIGHNRLSLVALAVAGFVALVLIGLWARHSQEAATLDSSYERSYPSRSINVAVPFPAGGPSDVVARVVTEQLGNTLGQSMVIEIVGGAGGTIGSDRSIYRR